MLTNISARNDQIQTEVGEEVQEEDEDEEDVQDGLQTFVFSATLSKDLQRNLKKRKAPGKSRKPRAAPASTLGKCATNLLSWLDERLGVTLSWSASWSGWRYPSLLVQ